MVFSAIASHSTKCIITTTNYPLDEPFVVKAVHYPEEKTTEGSVFMDRQVVNYDFEYALWRPVSDHFWPQDGTITFYAGSPDIPEVQVTEENGVVANWSIPSEEYTQTDLCYGEVTENCKTHSALIPVVFSHALSQICFKARSLRNHSYSRQEDNLIQANVITVMLDSVKIGGIVSEGRFTQKPKMWDLNHEVTSEYLVYKNEEGLELRCDRYDNPIFTVLSSMLLLPQPMTMAAYIEEWHHIIVRSSITDVNTGNIVSDVTNIFHKSARLPLMLKCEAWETDFKYTFRVAVGLEDTELAMAVTDWTETKEIIIGDE
ncbi:MAG: fimbrillin family protein [Bacteroidales bacterium]|nr:fimbrillin family protein [Bacteroidales bacterium]